MSYFEFPHTRTYDSDLGWLIKSVRKLIECCEDMQAWRSEHEAAYQELKALYNSLISGTFPPEIVTGLTKWFTIHGKDLIGDLVKMVIFGLNDNGYFVAYIPDNWSDIKFNTTGLDIFIANIDFGHLVLSFNV